MPNALVRERYLTKGGWTSDVSALESSISVYFHSPCSSLSSVFTSRFTQTFCSESFAPAFWEQLDCDGRHFFLWWSLCSKQPGRSVSSVNASAGFFPPFLWWLHLIVFTFLSIPALMVLSHTHMILCCVPFLKTTTCKQWDLNLTPMWALTCLSKFVCDCWDVQEASTSWFPASFWKLALMGSSCASPLNRIGGNRNWTLKKVVVGSKC